LGNVDFAPATAVPPICGRAFLLLPFFLLPAEETVLPLPLLVLALAAGVLGRDVGVEAALPVLLVLPVLAGFFVLDVFSFAIAIPLLFHSEIM